MGSISVYGGPNGFSFVVWKVNKYVEDGLMYVARNFVATSPASYSKVKFLFNYHGISLLVADVSAS